LQLLNTDEYQDAYPSSKEKDGGKKVDVGQVEYEMPLLAPSKDKRLMTLDEETVEAGPNEDAVQENYLHVKLKRK